MKISKISLAKSITWRITASLTTITLVYMMTGELTLALEIGAIELIAKIILYYLHEETWKKIIVNPTLD